MGYKPTTSQASYTDADAVAAIEAESGLTLAGTETRVALIENTHAAENLNVAKAASQGVINSAVLVNDSHLLLAVEANATYRLTLILRTIADTTAPDMKIGWTLPSGGTMLWEQTVSWVATGVVPLAVGNTLVLPCETTERVYVITGVVYISSTAGNCQLQWAQNVATAGVQTTVTSTSILRLEKII